MTKKKQMKTNKFSLEQQNQFMVQGVGFEPTKANANRFTVCRV